MVGPLVYRIEPALPIRRWLTRARKTKNGFFNRGGRLVQPDVGRDASAGKNSRGRMFLHKNGVPSPNSGVADFHRERDVAASDRRAHRNLPRSRLDPIGDRNRENTIL
jgi:hypothetical protein